MQFVKERKKERKKEKRKEQANECCKYLQFVSFNHLTYNKMNARNIRTTLD